MTTIERDDDPICHNCGIDMLREEAYWKIEGPFCFVCANGLEQRIIKEWAVRYGCATA